MNRIVAGALGIAAVTIIGAAAVFHVRNPEKQDLTDAERSGVPGKFVRLTDGVTHYELREPVANANGRTAVLVHGFSVPYYIWDSTAVMLSNAGYRVVRYDQYGRGYSDRPDADYSADFYSRQLQSLLDSLHITDRVDLMGLSMGGWVTASYVARHSDRVRTWTLVDPVATSRELPAPVRLPVVGAWFFQAAAVPGMAKGQASDFVHPEKWPTWEAQYEPQMRYRGFGRALHSTLITTSSVSMDSVYAAAGQKNIPTLLVWGKLDTTVPIDLAPHVRKGIPHAEWFPVDSAGHLPHIERADIVNPKILEFLGKAPL